MWDRDAVLVEEGLELGVIPGVDELVGEGLSRGGGRRRERSVLAGGVIGGNLGVATDLSDQLVTAAGLRGGDAALVHPLLQLRVRPGLIEPITRVLEGLAGLVGSRLVVGAGREEEGVASAGLRVRDAVVVEEGLQLRVGPAGPKSAHSKDIHIPQTYLSKIQFCTL